MMPRYLSQSIQLSGLEQKEWFHKWRKSVFTICAVIPLLMSVISDHFGFFNVQGLLILGGLLICLVLSLTPSLNIFKKDGDSKKNVSIQSPHYVNWFCSFNGIYGTYCFICDTFYFKFIN